MLIGYGIGGGLSSNSWEKPARTTTQSYLAKDNRINNIVNLLRFRKNDHAIK
jgi:hypothetical protein